MTLEYTNEHYHGVLYCVVSQRLIYSFGFEVGMQFLIFHHHHSDPLFHSLQLFLKSDTQK